MNNPLKLAAAIQKLRGVGSYLYPPFTAFLLTPLTSLAYEVAAGIFQVLSLSALLGFVWFLFRRHRAAVPGQGDAPFLFAILLATILLYRFLDGNAGNGNIGFFLILLCGAGVVFAFDTRSQLLEFVGGVLLGLATVLKITPGFLGLVLIGGRRIVAIFGMGAGALLALIAPATLLGWSRNLELFGNWYRLIVQTFSQMSFVRPWMNNQSISGAIGKLFVPGSDLKQAAYGLPIPGAESQEAVAAFAMGVKLSNLALVALGLLAAGVVAWRGIARDGRVLVARQAHGRVGLAEVLRPEMIHLLVLATLISLLAAGVSWYHAYCILFVPVALRLYQHAVGTYTLQRLDYAYLILFGTFGCGQALFSRWLRDLFSMYSVFAFLCVGLAIVLAVSLVLGRAYAKPHRGDAEG